MMQSQNNTPQLNASGVTEAGSPAEKPKPLEILNRIGSTLASELDLEKLVQSVTDAGREMTGAAFGAFFYNVTNQNGESYTLYTLSGVPRAAFEKFPMPRNTEVFGPTFRGDGIIRSADITKDPRYGKNAPYYGMPQGHLPVRSYLAAPVTSRSGKVLGGLFFGHPEPGIFTKETERFLGSIAAHASVAIDNAHLYRSLQHELAAHKKVEEALRDSEMRFRTMAEALPNLVWTDQPDGQCDWLSSQWARYTGIPEKDLLGLNWVERVLHPDDKDRTLQCWNAACSDRAEYDLEYRLRRHDGDYRWFKTRGVPIRDEKGKIIYWFGTCTDIQDIKEGEERERKLIEDAATTAHRLAAIVETSDDAIISKDLNGIIQSWNKGAERVFGYKPEETIGKSVTMLMPPENVNEEPAILQRLRRGEPIDHYETVRRRKDGTLLNVSLTVSPIKDATGKIVGASKIARDITDQVRAKEKLEQKVAERTASLREAIAQMEEFSYSVSHDLRSPVRAIEGYAKAIAEDYGALLPEEGKNYLDHIIQSSSRMERLIHDVLTYSRVTRMEMPLQRVALDALVKIIIHQYPEFHPERADIIVQPGLPEVMAHEPALGQAISNLLSNAVKFVPEGLKPRVEISGQKQNGAVVLNLKDNGIGIDPKYQHRLFGMFERIHAHNAYEGTGIGLAIVRKTIERMGGSVSLQSDGTNGSTFSIELRSP